MSAFALAGVLLAAATLCAPHVIPLHRASPPAAIAVWLLVLALRALAAVVLATLALVGLAEVPVVRAALAWCWHALLPELPGALGFAEHPVSHAAVAVPALMLAGSVAWLAARAVRRGLAQRRVLDRALGTGPLGTTVIHDERVVLAVTGFGRGRVLVSDRALGELDDDELAAGLTHEHAHLRRRHRPLLMAGAVLAAIARLLPGTRAAERELRFQLERDADDYTVRTLEDPLALASAICKTAGPGPGGAIAGLHGPARVTLRLEELLDGRPARSAAVERTAWALAGVLGVVLAAVVATAPAWGFGAGEQRNSAGAHACDHLP